MTVPSIWSHNRRQQMNSCMVDAGLVVGGSNGMNASANRVIMVLQRDIASYTSSEWLSLQRGDKVLLANTDMTPPTWSSKSGSGMRAHITSNFSKT